MAYGETLEKLSPCGDELITEYINRFCPEADSVIDVGCGRGERLAALGRRFPKMSLAGVDCDGDMIEKAGAGVDGDIRLADASSLPFESGSFALALCECSLSLFSRPEKSLEEICRVLRPGGVMILGDIYGRLLPEGDSNFCGDGIVGAVYARGNIEAMAEEAGFELLAYDDRSGDLAAMAAQMIFSGSCGCLDRDTLALLRQVKAGYGLWIFKKEEN